MSVQCSEGLGAFRFFFKKYSIGYRLYSIFFCTISAFFLYGEYVVRCFLPDDGVFLLIIIPCDHGQPVAPVAQRYLVTL